jgi:hypothetical protein
MSLPIHNHRNVFPPLQKLHHASALPSHLCPSRFGIRVLLQAVQFSILKTEIHLLLFAFRRLPDDVSFAAYFNGFLLVD